MHTHRDGPIEARIGLHPGNNRITVNGMEFQARDEAFPPDVRAQIRTVLRDPPPAIPAEQLEALRQTAMSFALSGATNASTTCAYSLSALAAADPGRPLEHQLSAMEAQPLISLSRWGLTPHDVTVDLRALQQFARDEERRVPVLADVVAGGLHARDPDLFAANRRESPHIAMTDKVEQRLLSDPATVQQAQRIILGHLARYGPLSMSDLLMLTGFSRKFLEPLVALEKAYEPKERQVSLLVSVTDRPRVMLDGHGNYQLLDASTLHRNQQQAIAQLRTESDRCFALFDAAERVVLILSQLHAEGGALSAPGSTADVPPSNPVQFESQLREVLNILKTAGVVEQDVSFETWSSDDWKIAHPKLSSAAGIVFALLGAGYEEMMKQFQSLEGLKQSRTGFGDATVDMLEERWIAALEPLLNLSVSGVNGRDDRHLTRLTEAFAQMRQSGLEACRAQIHASLDQATRDSDAQHAELSKIVNGDVEQPRDVAAQRQAAAAGRQTPLEHAAYLEEQVRVPRLMLQELHAMSGQGVDVAAVIGHLRLADVTPVVAGEIRAYLQARLSGDQAGQVTALKNVFALHDARQIGAQEYGDRMSEGLMFRDKRMTEVASYVERSTDALFVKGFMGLDPSDLTRSNRTFDSVWAPFAANGDIFIDGVVANLLQDEDRSQQLRRDLTQVFAEAFASGALRDTTMDGYAGRRIAGFQWTNLNALQATIEQVMRVRAFLRLEAAGSMNRAQFVQFVQSDDVFKSLSRAAQLLDGARRPEDARDLNIDLILQHLVKGRDDLGLELGLRLAEPTPPQIVSAPLAMHVEADSIAVTASGGAGTSPLLQLSRQGNAWDVTVPGASGLPPIQIAGQGELNQAVPYYDAFGALHLRASFLAGRDESVHDIAVDANAITIVSTQRLSNQSAQLGTPADANQVVSELVSAAQVQIHRLTH